jgi:hypothetical protein
MLLGLWMLGLGLPSRTTMLLILDRICLLAFPKLSLDPGLVILILLFVTLSRINPPIMTISLGMAVLVLTFLFHQTAQMIPTLN